MKILTTYSEISNRGNWEKFCKETGLSYYCMNEGVSGDTKVELTVEQAWEFGLLQKEIGRDVRYSFSESRNDENSRLAHCWG